MNEKQWRDAWSWRGRGGGGGSGAKPSKANLSRHGKNKLEGTVCAEGRVKAVKWSDSTKALILVGWGGPSRHTYCLRFSLVPPKPPFHHLIEVCSSILMAQDHGLASSFFFLSDERKACQLPYPKLCRQPWDCQYSNNSSTALFLGEKQHINPAEIGQRMQRTLVSLLIIALSTASLENTVVFFFFIKHPAWARLLNGSH